METLEKTINGFSSEAISNTIAALQNDPTLAGFKFRAHNQWINGGHNRSIIQDFYGCGEEDQSRQVPFVFDNSEPPVLLGNNEGANPVEFVLHALAGCLTTTMVLHAAAHGIQLDKVESKLEGDLDVQGFLGLDPSIRNGYKQIRASFKVEGNLTEEQRAKLFQFTQMSPVFDIVTNPIPVSVQFEN
jgi:uncharacterized OsmC-like protein